MKTILTISIICVLGLGAAYFLWPDEPETPEKAISKPIAEGSYAQVEGFTYQRTLNGKTEWELTADSAVYSEDRQIANFNNVEATFLGKDDNVLKMKGKNGRFFVDSQDVDLDGGVVVNSSAGYDLTTDRLHYSSETRIISTQSPVTIRSNSVVLTCNGLLLNIAEENFSLEGGVMGTVLNADNLFQGKGKRP